MKIKYIIIALVLIVNLPLYSQDKGEPAPRFNPDTTFIFSSPRPLITQNQGQDAFKNAMGLDLLFSASGFGAGFFYQRSFTNNFKGFISLYISGARNTDEFEYYDWNYNEYRVPDKINRLYLFPLMFGVKQHFFENELTETLRPYLSIGTGPAFIMSTPYEHEFFSAFKYAKTYTRWGAFLGAGANFGGSNKTLLGVNLRYYYIPFGNEGLESVENHPITNFGGSFFP